MISSKGKIHKYEQDENKLNDHYAKLLQQE